MEDTISTQVRLRNFDGEGFWVTPVSYMPHDFWEEPKDRNRLRLYNTPEFPPFIDFYLKTGAYDKYSHFPNLLRLYLWEAIQTSTKQFFSNSKYFFGSAVFDSSFSKRSWWDNVYYYTRRALEKDWFYCREVYPVILHIEGNIELVDEEHNYWEETYLTPTATWIEERLAEREGYTLNKDEWGEKFIECSLKDFYRWKKKQIDKGLNISYITSLET